MIRLPFWPTLIVAAAVATMIALGIWQLQRAQWKEGLIARLETARTLSPVDLAEGLRPEWDFRAAVAQCSVIAAKPQVRGGRSRDGRPGSAYFVPCSLPGGETLLLNAGWSPSPAAVARIDAQGPFSGILRHQADWGGPGPADYLLVLDRPLPGLAPSAQPSVRDIPNNHVSYALQWFFFAGIAALIYLLALRRRSAG